MRFSAPLDRGWLAGSLLAVLVFRFWFAFALPMTGDEAYFAVWGSHLSGGYYDHPPMIGWWLAAMLSISNATWWLRLPSVLMPFFLAWGAWYMLRDPAGPVSASAASSVGSAEASRSQLGRPEFAALLLLLQPTSVWNVLITNDTPVILFTGLSVFAYTEGLRRVSAGRSALLWHVWAGSFLGLAFLGKYFAVLLGLGFAAHVVFVRHDRARWGHMLALTAVSLFGPAWNLWWNSTHCWSNIVFNFVNRGVDVGFKWESPPIFLLSVVYLVTPWVLWMLWRHRRAESSVQPDVMRALVWLSVFPLLIFGAISFYKMVGVHWLLAFVPLLAVLAAARLPLPSLAKALRCSLIFAALHVPAAIVFLVLPTSVWEGHAWHAGVVLTLRTDEVIAGMREPMRQCGPDCVVAMDSYSSAATLSHGLKQKVVVFGSGSFHGRQDDFDTDFRALDGRDFIILRKETSELEYFAPYFERIDTFTYAVEGVPFHVLLAKGFRYNVYHQQILTNILNQFYSMPSWLPRRGCEFTDRYFPK